MIYLLNKWGNVEQGCFFLMPSIYATPHDKVDSVANWQGILFVRGHLLF